EALKNRDIEQFVDYTRVRAEYSYNHTRFDFLLTDEKDNCLLEVKSCTSVNDGVARFPDAVTERGRRQVEELMKAIKEGYRACVLFIIQRPDAHLFAPNDETDSDFGDALRKAVEEGVEIYAYCSEFTGDKIILKDEIEVQLTDS
ncbi:DNA/RNA nuclease SfsA, partial [Candidatus Bathyarchaeota archaeon]|nr:DNA/RNA nuclease SfsA [Candidatus Bathyarchaeota archaeon]NIR17438.1 DNA/RNA nuclease SfsA [Desulfobacterales bacterium]NIU81579.1 DNA/RNA nuclease SfsA [Candidatus Bathyarchaeota archaeon]NIV68221.1 DNA/RNA nuclease SfsA [Candidatus Bathyarchaeota archaeon]NIW16477.1 DNA/RNA nuclease SfsA [Candidatus Bathyarchaeota archaeon]